MAGRQAVAFLYLLCLVITTSVQVIGIYLVFASLILPAIAVHQAQNKPLAMAYVAGAIGYASGLLISSRVDLPPGRLLSGRWQLARYALCCLTSQTQAKGHKSCVETCTALLCRYIHLGT